MTNTIVQNGVTAKVERITPAAAVKMLTRNTRNRTLTPSTVERYARDMAAGEWRVTGEAIKFDNDGDVLDGQHRLHAIAQAGVTVETFVVRGLRPDAQDVMDTGKRRGANDALNLNGYRNSPSLAAAAKLALNFELGNIRSAQQQMQPGLTNAEIIRFIEMNADLLDAVSWAAAHKSKLPVRPSVIAFTRWACRRIDAEQADELFDDLANMRTNGQGDPRYTLLRRLSASKDEKTSAITEAHYLFRTWNAMRHGETLGNLKTGNAHGAFEFCRPL